MKKVVVVVDLERALKTGMFLRTAAKQWNPYTGLVQFIADLRNARARELEEKRINKELANIRFVKSIVSRIEGSNNDRRLTDRSGRSLKACLSRPDTRIIGQRLTFETRWRFERLPQEEVCVQGKIPTPKVNDILRLILPSCCIFTFLDGTWTSVTWKL